MEEVRRRLADSVLQRAGRGMIAGSCEHCTSRVLLGATGRSAGQGKGKEGKRGSGGGWADWLGTAIRTRVTPAERVGQSVACPSLLEVGQ